MGKTKRKPREGAAGFRMPDFHRSAQYRQRLREQRTRQYPYPFVPHVMFIGFKTLPRPAVLPGSLFQVLLYIETPGGSQPEKTGRLHFLGAKGRADVHGRCLTSKS